MALSLCVVPAELTAFHIHEQELRRFVDPIALAQKLKASGYISFDFYQTFLQKFNQGVPMQTMSCWLIGTIPTIMSLEQLVKSLIKCGYMNIACAMYVTYMKTNCIRLGIVGHVNEDRLERYRKFFIEQNDLKRLVNNGNITHSEQFLTSLTRRVAHQFEQETDPNGIRILADKYLTCLCGSIYAHNIKFGDNTLHVNTLLDELKSLIIKTSDPLLAEIVYYGRHAVASVVADQMEEGEHFVTAALVRAFAIGPCPVSINVIYIMVLCKLWQYEKRPVPQVKETLMMWGRIGLKCLEEEMNDMIRNTFSRMFILRMVFCLLGLGHKANIIVDFEFDRSDLPVVEELLAAWKMDEAESRRECLYYTARARQNALQNDMQTAASYAGKAEILARDNNFKELNNISMLNISYGSTACTVSEISETASGDVAYKIATDIMNAILPQGRVQTECDIHTNIPTTEQTGRDIHTTIHIQSAAHVYSVLNDSTVPVMNDIRALTLNDISADSAVPCVEVSDTTGSELQQHDGQFDSVSSDDLFGSGPGNTD